MKLEEHIAIFKKLKIFGKANLIRMVWHIATEHGKEISCEDFIKAQAYKKQVEVVEPIKKGK